jgi:hypothetical protein
VSIIQKIADGAYFVPSFSEQTIVKAYSVETTLQSFDSTYSEIKAEAKSGKTQQQTRTSTA